MVSQQERYRVALIELVEDHRWWREMGLGLARFLTDQYHDRERRSGSFRTDAPLYIDTFSREPEKVTHTWLTLGRESGRSEFAPYLYSSGIVPLRFRAISLYAPVDWNNGIFGDDPYVEPYTIEDNRR